MLLLVSKEVLVLRWVIVVFGMLKQTVMLMEIIPTYVRNDYIYLINSRIYTFFINNNKSSYYLFIFVFFFQETMFCVACVYAVFFY